MAHLSTVVLLVISCIKNMGMLLRQNQTYDFFSPVKQTLIIAENSILQVWDGITASLIIFAWLEMDLFL